SAPSSCASTPRWRRPWRRTSKACSRRAPPQRSACPCDARWPGREVGKPTWGNSARMARGLHEPTAFRCAMNILATAGNTLALIDKVRCITNIFTGRTGASIAVHAYEHGHRVTLLTSHPEAVAEVCEGKAQPGPERWWLRRYRTFEDLHVHL